MKKSFNIIRGAIGIGLTWGAAWLGVGLILLLVVGVGAADVPFPLFFGALGFLAGTTFSLILATMERRRRLDDISLPRFATFGALGGMVIAGIVNVAAGPAANFLPLAGLFAGAGALSASGTLALARSAERRAIRAESKTG